MQAEQLKKVLLNQYILVSSDQDETLGNCTCKDDIDQLSAGIDQFGAGITELSGAADYLSSTADYLSSAADYLSSATDYLSDIVDYLSGELSCGISDINNCIDQLSAAINDVRNSLTASGSGSTSSPSSGNTGSSGSNGGSSCGMFAWDEKNKSIGAGGAMFGRTWISAAGVGEKKDDGMYCLECNLASASCTVVKKDNDWTKPDGDKSWIPIYKIKDGKIETDYRGAFVVQCYE